MRRFINKLKSYFINKNTVNKPVVDKIILSVKPPDTIEGFTMNMEAINMFNLRTLLIRLQAIFGNC